MNWKLANFVRTPVTAVLCGGLALSLLLGDEPTRLVAPLLFLLAVIPVAAFLGRSTAIIGSAVASLTFTVLLFPPLYRLRIEHAVNRFGLISFQVLAIGLACLSDIRLAR